MNSVPDEPSTSANCQAIGCADGWVSILPIGPLNPSVTEAVFGIPRDLKWHENPEIIRVCRKHLAQLRRKDGYTLGYQMRDGKIRAYVKDEHF